MCVPKYFLFGLMTMQDLLAIKKNLKMLIDVTKLPFF